jgi:hypothetical protein
MQRMPGMHRHRTVNSKGDPLIRHIVMWKLKSAGGATREQNALLLKEKLEACRNAVPGIVRLDVGIATPGLDSTCDVVLVCDFTDKAALDAYQVHPAHQLVKAFLAPFRESREAVDYEI